MSKRVIAFLMAIVTLVTFSPVTSHAIMNGKSGGNTYITGGNYDNGGAFGTPIVVQNAIKAASNPKPQTGYSVTPKNNNPGGGSTTPGVNVNGGFNSNNGGTIAQESSGDSGSDGSSSVTPDLSVTQIMPDNARLNATAMSAVFVNNASPYSYDDVLVELSIDGGATIKKHISIDAGQTAIAIFNWTPQIIEASAKLTAEVNSDQAIAEADYSNNKLDKKVSLASPFYEADESHYYKKDFNYLDPRPAGENVTERTWTANGKDYWARLTIKATPVYKYSRTPPPYVPNAMKSGYGFEVNVHVELTTNASSSVVVGPQLVYMYVPELLYRNVWPFDKNATSAGVGALVNDWKLIENPNSPIKARKWYVPVWVKDGTQYEPVITAYGAFCPAGELTASTYVSIPIYGSMYEDDVTTLVWD